MTTVRTKTTSGAKVAAGEASSTKALGGQYIAPSPPKSTGTRVATSEAPASKKGHAISTVEGSGSTNKGTRVATSEATGFDKAAKKKGPTLAPKDGHHLPGSGGVKVTSSEAGK